MKGGLRHIALLVALIWCGTASAQYYSWGADPTSMRWRKIKGDKLAVIFPDTATNIGYELMYYAKTIQPSVSFGFRRGPMNIPFIIHPENARSNGMVMWLPRRVEILSSPAIDGYSTPWLKQLVAHEYRHAVQYNNLDRGWVRAFSYLLGQQSKTIGLLFMPLWALEGDAVISETAMSAYGRALQPSFTMHYRAVGERLLERKNTDKWFCGSYREHIPDHYHIGYQVTAYADTKYDENIWDRIIHYAVRNPYVFATTAVALKKFYQTNTNALIRETFTDLNRHWASLPTTCDTSERIPAPAQRSYTTYRYPMPFGSKHIISLKEDLDRPTALVKTNTETGEESRICYTGNISTRPTMKDGRIWWTEYQRSVLFQQRVNSRLCYVDLGKHRSRTIYRYRNVLYPTVVDDSDLLVWVEYRPNGTYAVMRGDRRHRSEIAVLPFGVELHSLAYDNQTRHLYFIATSDDGMWLGRVNDDGSTTRLTDGAYITISDLRARDGVLYFGSIQSGKDEAHCYDIASGEEYRISNSRYGSFSPMPDYDGKVLMTTYDSNGYQLARQTLDRKDMLRVQHSRLPLNTVNPPRKTWDVPNLDSVRFDSTAIAQTKGEHRARRYSKFTHLFNIHSWAPASYNPFELTEEGKFDFNLGVTLITQNLLSSADGYISWGWNAKEGHFYKGSLRYYGLGANIAVSGSYGGTQQLYTVYTYEKDENGKYNIVFPEEPKLDKYYNIQASVSLPLYFQCGYCTRYLGINAAWNYSNGLVVKTGDIKIENGRVTNLAKIGYTKGLHLLQFGIGYQNSVRLAHKDFLPRWSQTLSFNYAFNPANSDFGRLVSLYGKFYLPGFAAHNSLSLALLYQTSIGGFDSKLLASNLSFNSSRLIPRGFYTVEISNHNYFAASLNYQLPICYPEGGIPSILYFKRIRLNVGVDYASFNNQYFVEYPNGNLEVASKRKHLISYGGDITFDVNLFRMPAAATSAVTVSIYKPHGKKGLYVSAGVGLPF